MNTSQIYFVSDLDDSIYVLCIMGGFIYGKSISASSKTEKLKMLQQPVSNEFPLRSFYLHQLL